MSDGKMYAVRVVYKDGITSRYVAWCDEHWYETTRESTRRFTKEEAEEIARLMFTHYVYTVVLESEGGEEVREFVSHGRSIDPDRFIDEDPMEESPLFTFSHPDVLESHIIEDVPTRCEAADEEDEWD